MNAWETIKKKYLGRIGKAVSWLFNIASLVLAAVSLFNNNGTDLNWRILLAIIIFNSIFLIIISVYESLIFRRGSAIENRLSDQLRLSNNQADKLRYYYKYIIATLNKFSTQLLAVYYKLQQAYDDINAMESEYNALEESHTVTIQNLLERSEATALEEYISSTEKQFDHFLSNITSRLKQILDISLHQKGCSLETSISVKQFNRIVTDPHDISDVMVITSFRNNESYSQGKREIGERQYHIDKNTDFLFCLSKPYFLKNNIKANDKSYENEHEDFLSYYNCTIVVPIKCAYPNSDHIFGYLACDILNQDFSQDDLLDDKMAEIMQATANIMGLYFDDIDYQWSYVLNDDFLRLICKRKIALSNSEVKI